MWCSRIKNKKKKVDEKYKKKTICNPNFLIRNFSNTAFKLTLLNTLDFILN